MKLLSGLFRSRDKPRNSTSRSSYRFFYGQSSSGKCVTERSAMQMTAVYACVRILSEAVAGRHFIYANGVIRVVKKKLLNTHCIFFCTMSQIRK